MIPLLIDGRKVELPTGWHKVTTEQYILLIQCGNDLVKSLSILTGIPEETLNSATFSEGLDHLFSQTKFLTEPVQMVETPVKCGEYDLKPEIPNLQLLNQMNRRSWELKEAVSKLDVKTDLIDIALEVYRTDVKIAAIYCQGTSEPFDAEKAGYLAGQFMKLPCIDVLSCGNYYRTKALSIAEQRSQSIYRQGTTFKKPKTPFLSRLKQLWRSR